MVQISSDIVMMSNEDDNAMNSSVSHDRDGTRVCGTPAIHVTDAGVRALAAHSQMNSRGTGNGSSISLSPLDASLAALSNTLAHAQRQRNAQEEVMISKLRAKGITVGQTKSEAQQPTTTAASIHKNETSNSEVGAIHAFSASTPPAASSSNRAKRSVRSANDEGAVRGAASTTSAVQESSSSAAVAKPVDHAPNSTSSSSSSSSVQLPTLASDLLSFDAFLAKQFGPSLNANEHPIEEDEEQDSSDEHDQSTVSDRVTDDAVLIDPIALSSFLHIRHPLSSPHIPSLQQLCCAALALQAQRGLLPSQKDERERACVADSDVSEFDLHHLPTHLLTLCMSLVKRPMILPPSMRPAAPHADPIVASILPPEPGDSARFTLNDDHLLPFIHPQLDSFTLDPPAADSITGGVQGLGERWSATISTRLIDMLAHRCTSLMHLSLHGYTHSFTHEQLRALANCPMRSLALAHCQLMAAEVEVLVEHYTDLHYLDISWCSFLSCSGGAVTVQHDILPSLMHILAPLRLRASLRTLKVDGARTNPNILVCQALKQLPLLTEFSFDSVAPPNQDRGRRGLTSVDDAEREAEALRQAALAQLTEDNVLLKLLFERSQKESKHEQHTERAVVDDSSAHADAAPNADATLGDGPLYPHLTSLSATDTVRFSSETLSFILSHAPNLTSLTLKGCSHLRNVVLRQIVSCCPKLMHLNVADVQAMDDEVVEALAFNFNRLQSHIQDQDRTQKSQDLDEQVDGTGVESAQDAQQQATASDSEIESPISDLSPSASGHAHASSPPSGSFLRSIDLSWCESVSDTALAALFDMVGCTDEELKSAEVQKATTLQTTTLDTPDMAALSLPAAEVSPFSPPLHSSTIPLPSSSPLSPSRFTRYRLERVIVSCSEELSDSTLARLAKHRSIIELDVSRCRHVSLANMLQADGSEGNIERHTIPSTSSIPEAHRLPFSHLIKLNLSWTNVKDADVVALLNRCRRLQHLNLEGCKHLTDGCATGAAATAPMSLLNLSFLSFFYVSDVTLHGMVALIEASPCYWLQIRDYYGLLHDRATLHQDKKDLRAEQNRK